MKKVDEPFSAARLMTTETKRPVAGYFWSQGSKIILLAKDHDGDENFNYTWSIPPHRLRRGGCAARARPHARSRGSMFPRRCWPG